jgi:hypothetical protein
VGHSGSVNSRGRTEGSRCGNSRRRANSKGCGDSTSCGNHRVSPSLLTVVVGGQFGRVLDFAFIHRSLGHHRESSNLLSKVMRHRVCSHAIEVCPLRATFSRRWSGGNHRGLLDLLFTIDRSSILQAFGFPFRGGRCGRSSCVKGGCDSRGFRNHGISDILRANVLCFWKRRQSCNDRVNTSSGFDNEVAL